MKTLGGLPVSAVNDGRDPSGVGYRGRSLVLRVAYNAVEV
jgi:hypothetical protein